MRSLVRVGLRPSRDHKISFRVQLGLVLVWISYSLVLIFTEPGSSTNDRHFMHYIFLILAVGYLLFILAQNTPLFGTQSYLEITPAYVVEKRGHFKKKVAIYLQEVTALAFTNTQARFTMNNGSRCQIDLRLVSNRKSGTLVREKLMEVAQKHGIPVTDSSTNTRR